MQLLIIRHAIAEEKTRFARSGKPDAKRPLTAVGRRKFKKSLKGLGRAAPDIRLLATSPFVRARQTCELAKKIFPKARVVVLPALASGGNPRALTAWLAARKTKDAVAIVGHEPDLSKLAALLTGAGAPAFTFKKGGAALIVFDGRALRGHGSVEWLLTPALMRRVK